MKVFYDAIVDDEKEKYNQAMTSQCNKQTGQGEIIEREQKHMQQAFFDKFWEECYCYEGFQGRNT